MNKEFFDKTIQLLSAFLRDVRSANRSACLYYYKFQSPQLSSNIYTNQENIKNQSNKDYNKYISNNNNHRNNNGNNNNKKKNDNNTNNDNSNNNNNN